MDGWKDERRDERWMDGWMDMYLTIRLNYETTYYMAVAQWLKYCATNRKVVGSISGGVIGIFH
jgi:hypothetical protein